MNTFNKISATALIIALVLGLTGPFVVFAADPISDSPVVVISVLDSVTTVTPVLIPTVASTTASLVIIPPCVNYSTTSASDITMAVFASPNDSVDVNCTIPPSPIDPIPTPRPIPTISCPVVLATDISDSGIPLAADIEVSVYCISATPLLLTSTSNSSSQITLFWKDVSDNEKGFKIERRTTTSPTFEQIITTGLNTVSYKDINLSANTKYEYRIRATNGFGDSAYSNNAIAKTFDTRNPACPKPSSTVTDVTDTDVVEVPATSTDQNNGDVVCPQLPCDPLVDINGDLIPNASAVSDEAVDSANCPPSVHFPQVTISAFDADAGETNGKTGIFRITRRGVTTFTLSVNLTITGTANNGTDYAAIKSPQVIPAGASILDITVKPIDDAIVESSESVIATLNEIDTYTVGVSRIATVMILDNDPIALPIPPVVVAPVCVKPSAILAADLVPNASTSVNDTVDINCTIAQTSTATTTATTTTTVPTPAPTPAPSGGGNNGGGGGGGGGSSYFTNPILATGSGISGGSLPKGEVLGASITTVPFTACSSFITVPLRMGYDNPLDQVIKLQLFLNLYMNAGIPIDGFFDIRTENAVNAFQVKYSQEVLLPWVPFGLPTSTTPTGYVYKTTSRMMNNMSCSALNLPMPQLP